MTIAPPSREELRTNPKFASEYMRLLRTEHARRYPDAKTVFETPGDLARALNPTTVQTKALDIIDAALVRVANGESKRLIISMPPQQGKSERTTHYGALWMLYRNPMLRMCIVSYGDRPASRFSYRIRADVLEFNGSRGTVDLGLRLQKDSKAASQWNLEFPAMDTMYAIGIGSALTSRPVDVMFIDDPVKDFRAADSMLQSENAWEWWQTVARPRLGTGPNAAPVILILTRWHESDLAGRLIAAQRLAEKNGESSFDQWEVINIPAQAEHDPAAGETDILGREPGEFMDSARKTTEAQWRATKNATGSRFWSALFQGHPSPDGGDVWRRNWWRRYETPLWTTVDGSIYTIPDCDQVIMSWDMTFKDTRSSDYVVAQVWAQRGADVYLVDQIRARMTFTETLLAFENLVRKWPQATTKLVEDKANGTAVIDSLKKKIPGIVAINPTESKYARASAVAPFIEAGNVHLPVVAICVPGFDSVEDLITEAAGFPNAAHDDTVDTASQALARMLLRVGSGTAFLEAMKARANADGTTVTTATRAWRDHIPQKAEVGSNDTGRSQDREPVPVSTRRTPPTVQR